MTKTEISKILGDTLFNTTWDGYVHPLRMRLMTFGFLLGVVLAVAAWRLLYKRWRPRFGDLPAFFLSILSGTVIVLAVTFAGLGISQLASRSQPTVAGYLHYINKEATDPSSQYAARLLKDHEK
ncbi:MAG TPA: hypothetical protein VGM95_02300 [Lactobacillaceae bacterium]|jgi:hypothetical protein